VSDKTWKCYRCNLTFQSSDHAQLHEKLTNHKVSAIKSVII